jgi:hypothetical protein
MALGLSTTLRTARVQAIIDAAGSSAKIKYYNGTQPATGGAATTLLATLFCGSVLGTAASGVLTFGPVTQNNANHVSGTPTWMRITTSADVFVADINIGALGETFTGTIATGVDITFNAHTITEGNA